MTAIVGDPGECIEFYAETLGLRLVKRTVNHDDPETYHLYFADGEGTPGTSMTVFPWTAEGRPGEVGAGQVTETAFLVPPDALGYWRERLDDRGVAVTETERFGDQVLSFTDPSGLRLELVATDAPSDAVPWAESPVPADAQLRGFHGVTLAVADAEPTAAVLTDVLGFEPVAETATERGARTRFRSGPGGPGSVVDLLETGAATGTEGVGTVHHVAFEAADVATEEAFIEAYREAGLDPTEVIDRKYFRSIYTREPGGVLFEMATPEPGFTVDEPVEELGTGLRLPEWLEADREAIAGALPELGYDGPAVEAD